MTTSRFTSTLTIGDEGKAFSYSDTVVQQRTESVEPMVHTDSNTLGRV